MEKLTEAISRVCEVEKLIYEEGGELSPATEQYLDAAQRDLQTSVEAVAFAYKKRQVELEYIKQAYKTHVDSRKTALAKFKEIILQAAKRHGKNLKTPVASIGVVKKKTASVAILDFDTVCENHKEAVSIFTEDNKRIITLNKTMLKEIYEKKGGAVHGFDLLQRETEYPNIRIKGWNSDIALGHLTE